MKFKRLCPILLSLTALLISGCSNQPEPSSSEPPAPTPTYLEKDVTVKMNPMLKADTSTPYNLSFKYDDHYFEGNAKTYDKDLSMLSYGASIATASKEKGTTFLYETGFDSITPYGYETEPTTNSIGYFIAHKTINDFELVTVAFRGFDYKMEWANNLTIGKTGNHEGFDARGKEAYNQLQSYLKNFDSNKTVKLWINGYSRAGAVSNVLASYILKENKLNITQENMFVYTFEAPASLNEENAVAYENVHNITNQADLITFIPPTQYGLKRCGVDYQIYDDNVSTLLNAFDEEIIVPEFVAIEDLADEPLASDMAVRDYILASVFNKKEEEGEPTDVYANAREQYVDNYQTGLSLGIGFIFALKESTRAKLLNDLKELGFGAIMIIADQTGEELANFMKTYLDQDKIMYDYEILKGICAVLVKGIQNLFLTILVLYLGDTYKGDLERLLDMHYPETTYVLLKNAHQKTNA